MMRAYSRGLSRPARVRIAEEAIGRMPEKTPRARGARLVDALIVWITPEPPKLKARPSTAWNVCGGEDGFPTPPRPVPPGRRGRTARPPPAGSSASLVEQLAGCGGRGSNSWQAPTIPRRRR